VYLRFYVDRQHFTTCKSIYNLLNFITAFLLQTIPYTSLWTLVHYTFRHPYTSLCILLNFSFRPSPYTSQCILLNFSFRPSPYTSLCTLLNFSFISLISDYVPYCISPSGHPISDYVPTVFLLLSPLKPVNVPYCIYPSEPLIPVYVSYCFSPSESPKPVNVPYCIYLSDPLAPYTRLCTLLHFSFKAP
jgi:hypothetical protein